MENLEFNEECLISKYYTPSEFSHLSLDNSNIFVHLNISSLSYYISLLHLSEDIYRRNYKTLNHDKFKGDFYKIDWTTLLYGNNINVAFDNFLEKVGSLINKHLPLEKVSKRKLKQQKRKPWISNDLLK